MCFDSKEPFVQVHDHVYNWSYLTLWTKAIAANQIKMPSDLALSNEIHVYFSTWMLSKITAPDAWFTFFSPCSKQPYSF